MSLKLTSGALIAGLCLAATGTAAAAEPGWYVIAFGGQTSGSGFTTPQGDENLTAIIERAGFDVVDIDSTVDDSDTGFGLGGGYQVNDHFALEFAYMDIGRFAYRATATISDGNATDDVDATLENQADGPVVALHGILPIGERFSIYGSAGLALVEAEGKVRITQDGVPQGASQSSQKTSFAYGVGAEYAIGKYFAIRLAWDRYTDIGTDDVAGDIDADLFSLGIRMGVGWFR